MADEGAGFWLPSEFLDDFLMDNDDTLTAAESDSDFCFPTEFPYHHDEHLEKPRVMSTSPQSTLARIDSWPAGGTYQHKAPNPSVIHHVYLQRQRQKQGCGMWNSEAPIYGTVMGPVHRNGAGAVLYGGGAAVKRECAGTGVFLPRRYVSSESRKRQGASIPNRNLHSHKISDNLNGFPQSQPHLYHKFNPEYDLLMARRNAMMLQHRRSLLLEGSSRSRLFIE